MGGTVVYVFEPIGTRVLRSLVTLLVRGLMMAGLLPAASVRRGG